MKPAHPKPGVLRDSPFAFLIRLSKLGPLGYHVVNTTLLP